MASGLRPPDRVAVVATDGPGIGSTFAGSNSRRVTIWSAQPAQRAVIVLRVQQGLDPAAVCGILGVGDGNMRVLLHRARLSLRARLAELT